MPNRQIKLHNYYYVEIFHLLTQIRVDRLKNSSYSLCKSGNFLPTILFKVDLLNFSIYCNVMQNPPNKLLAEVRDIIRLKHYSDRTYLFHAIDT